MINIWGWINQVSNYVGPQCAASSLQGTINETHSTLGQEEP